MEYAILQARQSDKSDFIPIEDPDVSASGSSVWLIVVAEEPIIKPLANIIGNYTCNDSFYE
ncbi:MAG: hypothetical protein FWD44_07775 [Oscillospiraceae bacterium]|nr:hypothetical protein [Oscillospiraceae bacterium]